MRRLVTTVLALTVLALPTSALADAGITLSDGGFTPQSVVIKPGESVTFTNNSTGQLQNVQFSDESSTRCGALDPAGSCTRQFPNAGQFTFYDQAHGCSDYASCADPYRGVVIVDGPPSVTSLSGPTSGTRGQSLSYTAAASDPNGDSISSFNWDFGDGTSATTADGNLPHVYSQAGHFTITVTATDSRGNVSQPVTLGVDIAVPDTDGDGINDDNDKCPTVPGVPPDGCPLVAPVVPPPLATTATAPGALATVGALKSGVNVVLNCSAACTGVFNLTYKGKPVAVPTTAALTASGSELVTLKFTSAGKRLIAKVKQPRLLMSVAVTDALGRVQTDKRSVLLEQVKTYGKLPAIGISDNQPTTFADPNFQVLKLKFARLVEPWNGIFTEPGRLDQWLQAARANGIRPLISFEHSRGMVCPGRRCKGPTTTQYRKAWAAFHKKYPWVKDISPWNEANSSTQPTGKYPSMAAGYYNIVRASCRGCTIIAADLLDAPNIGHYALAFLAAAKGNPRLWGLHNYTDTNRFRARGTNTLLATVKGTVWLTETGGVVRFVTQSGKVALPRSESRAKKAMAYMFQLAEQHANRIKRIYVYQWKVNNVFDRFDAGVVRPDGTPRPSYQVLTLNASIASKH